MITGFRDAWLHDFFVLDKRNKRIPADIEDRLFRKIQMIDDAVSDQDLRVPPSNHFEKLRGVTGWLLFDPREQAMAVGLPMGWSKRRGLGTLSR